MEVRIQSIHFDASEQLQAFIQKKAAKLERFYDDIQKVEVSLKVVKPETAENKEAGVSTGGNGLTPGQRDALAGARDSNDKNRSAALAAIFEDEREKEAQAMRDYLAEYGSYEEKKLAITKEYEKRIA